VSDNSNNDEEELTALEFNQNQSFECKELFKNEEKENFINQNEIKTSSVRLNNRPSISQILNDSFHEAIHSTDDNPIDQAQVVDYNFDLIDKQELKQNKIFELKSAMNNEEFNQELRAVPTEEGQTIQQEEKLNQTSVVDRSDECNFKVGINYRKKFNMANIIIDQKPTDDNKIVVDEPFDFDLNNLCAKASQKFYLIPSNNTQFVNNNKDLKKDAVINRCKSLELKESEEHFCDNFESKIEPLKTKIGEYLSDFTNDKIKIAKVENEVQPRNDIIIENCEQFVPDNNYMPSIERLIHQRKPNVLIHRIDESKPSVYALPNHVKSESCQITVPLVQPAFEVEKASIMQDTLKPNSYPYDINHLKLLNMPHVVNTRIENEHSELKDFKTVLKSDRPLIGFENLPLNDPIEQNKPFMYSLPSYERSNEDYSERVGIIEPDYAPEEQATFDQHENSFTIVNNQEKPQIILREEVRKINDELGDETVFGLSEDLNMKSKTRAEFKHEMNQLLVNQQNLAKDSRLLLWLNCPKIYSQAHDDEDSSYTIDLDEKLDILYENLCVMNQQNVIESKDLAQIEKVLNLLLPHQDELASANISQPSEVNFKVDRPPLILNSSLICCDEKNFENFFDEDSIEEIAPKTYNPIQTRTQIESENNLKNQLKIQHENNLLLNSPENVAEEDLSISEIENYNKNLLNCKVESEKEEKFLRVGSVDSLLVSPRYNNNNLSQAQPLIDSLIQEQKLNLKPTYEQKPDFNVIYSSEREENNMIDLNASYFDANDDSLIQNKNFFAQKEADMSNISAHDDNNDNNSDVESDSLAILQRNINFLASNNNNNNNTKNRVEIKIDLDDYNNTKNSSIKVR
jgi:hypothetical protein